MDLMQLDSAAYSLAELKYVESIKQAPALFKELGKARLEYYHKQLNKLHLNLLRGNVSKDFYSGASVFTSVISDAVVSLRTKEV